MDTINIQINNMTLLDILNNDNLYNYTITSDMGSDFKFGVCICDCLEFELNNTDKRFDDINFRADTVRFNKNGSIKTFYIDDLQKKNGKIKIIAYDKMCKLEKTFKYKQIKTPITLKSLMEKVLTQCNISYNLSSFSNQNYVIHDLTGLKGNTCRQVMEYCLDLASANGVINSEEIFELRKYKTVRQYIEVENVKSFVINDEITHQVNNILYKRSDLEFTKTDGNNRCIVLKSNNPLLKICSTNKVQQILNNVDSYYIFLPCEIEIIDNNTYQIGDYLSLTYENKEYLFYVNKIIDKNNVYKKITCVSTLTEEEAAEEIAGSDFKVTGNIEWFYSDELTEVNLQECSNNTKIFYSINFNAENSGYFNVLINDKYNRQFLYKAGDNNITGILNYKFADSVNKFTLENLNIDNVDNYALSILYRDCLIVDNIDETDYPNNKQIIEEGTEGTTTSIEYKYITNIYGLMTLNKNASLVVSQDFFNQVVPSKVGTEELVINSENAKIYYKYTDTGLKLVFKGKYNNVITFSEKDMGEIIVNENGALKYKYYTFKSPIKLGEILEYKKPFIINTDGTAGLIERIKTIDDGTNVIYSDYVLENVLFRSGAYKWGGTWDMVLTTGQDIPLVETDTIIYKNSFLDGTHYANGSFISKIDASAVVRGTTTWFTNNTVGSRGTLIKSKEGIKFYEFTGMDDHYYGYEFNITEAAVELEKEQDANFYTMGVYTKIPLSETGLKYPTTT